MVAVVGSADIGTVAGMECVVCCATKVCLPRSERRFGEQTQSVLMPNKSGKPRCDLAIILYPQHSTSKFDT